MKKPYIVAIGGTTRSGSMTERVLLNVLSHAENGGARIKLLGEKNCSYPCMAQHRFPTHWCRICSTRYGKPMA